jgi:hypothetical protein
LDSFLIILFEGCPTCLTRSLTFVHPINAHTKLVL